MKKVRFYDKPKDGATENCACCGSVVTKKGKYHDAFLLLGSSTNGMCNFSGERLGLLYLCWENVDSFDCDVVEVCKYDEAVDAYISLDGNRKEGTYINCDEPNSIEFANLIRGHFGVDKYSAVDEIKAGVVFNTNNLYPETG